MFDASRTLSVSVILPTFNRGGYIREALVSILGQSHRPSEIIVVDDGSTDDTARVCAEFADTIHYLRQAQNSGKSAAINRGLALARGDCIWVMDDDDIAPADALAQLVEPLQQDSTLGFSYGPLQKFSENSTGARRFEPPQRLPADTTRALFALLMEDCFITGQPCTLVRRACFAAIAPLDEAIYASVDYNVLLQLARRYEGRAVDGVVLWQRQHAGLRGPAAIAYGETERVRRWAASDARLLRRLLPDLRLPEYLGFREPGKRLTPLQTREALLQKAVIAARKDIWDVAIGALEQARVAEPGLRLTDTGRAALQNMLGCRYGIDDFIYDACKQTALAAAAGEGPLGGEIRRAVASRLTFWIGQALRTCDARRLAATSRALVRLSGRDTLKVGLTPIMKRLSTPPRAATTAPADAARIACAGAPLPPQLQHRMP